MSDTPEEMEDILRRESRNSALVAAAVAEAEAKKAAKAEAEPEPKSKAPADDKPAKRK